MFNKTIVCVLFVILSQINIVKGNDELNKIVTYHTPEYGLHYVHALNPKETIYSLSKFSGTSVQEIYDINGLNKTAILSVGQELIIPVKNETIVTHKTKANSANASFIKVMYQVKKKDNLFQIAKRYFNTDINTLVDRNQLNGLTISPNQMLHVGWMFIDHSLPVNINSVVKEDMAVVSNPNSPAIKPAQVKEIKTQETVYVQKTSQTAQEVVNNTIEEVNDEVNSGPIQHKYRVVQHTPIRTTKQELSEADDAQAIKQTTIKAPVDTLSVSYTKTEVNAPSTSTSESSSIAHPVVSASSSTVVATAEKSKIDEDDNVKKRDYPDLSFLSSPNLLTKKGVAMWDKNDNEPLNMFILHDEAQINSYIRIENPMLGRIVLAKVVARLPSNVYDSDVKMVVSSAVATSLGVKDARFLAEMKYIK